MHPAALQWAKLHVPELPRRVVDIGGADINCPLRNLYTWSDYRCVDAFDGPGVDIVAPFEDWARTEPEKSVDLVVCFEVFEHTKMWPEMIVQAARILEDGGLFVGTCAGPQRSRHSAWGGPEPLPGEFYRNVELPELADMLELFSDVTVRLTRSHLDLQWVAIR